MRAPSGVAVVKTETIPCTPNEFLEFVLDIEGYAEVDDKIAPVLWSRRDGNVVQFACLPKIAGLRLPKVVQTMRLTSGERIDIGLNPPPANRLAHAVARFEASVACRAVPRRHRGYPFAAVPVRARLSLAAGAAVPAAPAGGGSHRVGAGAAALRG
jgi:hypothetical protein